MLNEDLHEVLQIEQSANQFPWSLKNFSDSLDAGHHAWVYSDSYDVIVGYAIVQLVMDEAHLLNLCVRPDMQGQGYGHRILEHIIEHVKTRAATLIVLEVRRSNIRAQRLYEQMGFNEIAVRRGYYPAQQGREDAILMGLDLSMLSIFGGL
ncbi:ribosomal protein S18-alanine N-acetyltransferase [Methylophaga sp. OBS4]|uniref:ribosomal protein S18-alanine N-acetyltransferase n=1 Tax=Methylophaga sp. OBS4 TaxID=2991935 RepID=UPI002256F2E9|nr:ribosomal protein S18-alanine N-acetyltransferase [Methylophaga sp. OBS4]MCX4188368.1 ribosomal protein S18-alanine N-acetyltransferase [Methylophaga sp. OBS4]